MEFIQGIPQDLEKDTFISPDITNIIVLDDLMSTSAKDPRINDIFTEGSHHRNLSVIALNQNLYYGKDSTQKRNCHCLTLFNSPIDQQPIMTLARQMYPGDHMTYMKVFREAVKIPFGCLTVDLKPFTDETKRLRANVLKPINTNKSDTLNHSANHQRPGNIPPPVFYQESKTLTDDMATIIKTSCMDCGQLFAAPIDLQKHVKRGCPEADSSDVEEGIYTRKRSRYESDSEYDEDMEYTDNELDDDEEGFELLVQKVWDNYDHIYQKKMDELMESDDLSEEKARREASSMLHSKYKRALVKEYKSFLNLMFLMKSSPIHIQITNDINKYVDEGSKFDSALDMAIKRNNYVFDGVLNKFDDDDDDDDDDDTSDGDSNTEEQSSDDE